MTKGAVVRVAEGLGASQGLHPALTDPHPGSLFLHKHLIIHLDKAAPGAADEDIPFPKVAIALAALDSVARGSQ